MDKGSVAQHMKRLRGMRDREACNQDTKSTIEKISAEAAGR